MVNGQSTKLFNTFIILLLITLTDCTKKPDLKGFNLEKWKADKGGCKGQRTSQVAELKAIKQELKGVSSNDILAYFGAPDIQRLSERNQEYFIYFVENGPHCGSLKPISNARAVVFRFSAIKLATEINFQNGSNI
jgi:hypothetical protein